MTRSWRVSGGVCRADQRLLAGFPGGPAYSPACARRWPEPLGKVAENILCDMFTTVLDWSTEQIRLQESRADTLLTRLGVKYLIVVAKRPGSLDGPAVPGR